MSTTKIKNDINISIPYIFFYKCFYLKALFYFQNILDQILCLCFFDKLSNFQILLFLGFENNYIDFKNKKNIFSTVLETHYFSIDLRSCNMPIDQKIHKLNCNIKKLKNIFLVNTHPVFLALHIYASLSKKFNIEHPLIVGMGFLCVY